MPINVFSTLNSETLAEVLSLEHPSSIRWQLAKLFRNSVNKWLVEQNRMASAEILIRSFSTDEEQVLVLLPGTRMDGRRMMFRSVEGSVRKAIWKNGWEWTYGTDERTGCVTIKFHPELD